MQSTVNICNDFLWIYAKSRTRNKTGDNRRQQFPNLTWKVYFSVDFVFYSVLDPRHRAPNSHSSLLPYLLKTDLSLTTSLPCAWGHQARRRWWYPLASHCLLIASDLRFWSQRPRISWWFCWATLAYSTRCRRLTRSYVYLMSVSEIHCFGFFSQRGIHTKQALASTRICTRTVQAVRFWI